MDKVKTPKSNGVSQKSKMKVIVAIISAVVVLSVWASNNTGTLSINRTDLLVDTVKRGDIEVVIEGYGVLSSDKQQLITAFSPATVKEIVLKPGAHVQADSIIVQLENPELLQQLENAKQQLVQAKANLRQLKLNNQREILNESATLAEISASHETAVLKRLAEETLVESGIVSRLDFQQSVLDEKQLKKRIEILTERSKQLVLVHQESVNIQQERVNQQQGSVDIAQSRIDKLTVRAGFDGVLQRLSVELGQSLAVGQEVALIGSATDLIALILVPQSQAQQIRIGQSAEIDTRRDKISGTVSRIDPVVVDNTVEVEIALLGELPASARPQLSIDGVITADTLINVNYITRPAGVKSNSTAPLYKLSSDQTLASIHSVKFGRQAGNFIELVSGVNPQEQFIISDLRNIQTTHDTLSIE